jgi:hypothetical protein
MRHQQIILTGIIVWLGGVFLDIFLIEHASLVIIIGTVISVVGAIKWLRDKNNRTKLRQALKINTDFGKMIKETFDFSWWRVSIIWTICAFGGMLLVHLGSVMMKSMGAYECAVQAIRKDQKVINQVGEIRGFTYMVTGHATTGDGISELSFGVIGTKNSVMIKAVIKGQSGSYTTNEIIVKE